MDREEKAVPVGPFRRRKSIAFPLSVKVKKNPSNHSEGTFDETGCPSKLTIERWPPGGCIMILAALQAGDTRYTTVHIIDLTTAPEPVGHTVFPSSPNPIVVSLTIFRFFLKLSILSKNPVLNLYL